MLYIYLDYKKDIGIAGLEFVCEAVEAGAVPGEAEHLLPGLQSGPGRQGLGHLNSLEGGENSDNMPSIKTM